MRTVAILIALAIAGAACEQVTGTAESDGGLYNAYTYDGESNCFAYVDNRQKEKGAEITFPSTDKPSQYVANCIAIHVGQTVLWRGDFTLHPLVSDGKSGNPILAQSTGTESEAIAFPDPGRFGFHCSAHSEVMWGEVKVLPD